MFVYSHLLEDGVKRLRSGGFDVPVRHWIASGPPENGFEELIERHRGQRPGPEWTVGTEDVSGIWFTSGTTGRPKAATVTHSSGLWAAAGLALAVGLTDRHRILATAPAFHRGPMEGLHLAGFLVGASHVMLTEFDPAEMLRAIEHHRITHAFIVPAMTWAVLSLPDRGNYDLTSMRGWFSASAQLPPAYRDRLEAETTLPAGRVYDAYGITESLILTMLRPHETAAHPGSVGSAVPGAILRVVDGERRERPAGEVGEIVAAAPSIAAGYWGQPDAWEAVTFEQDGCLWYHSGDLGFLDEDGFLHIVDRAKDMVISGGENVYSAEVERVLVTAPGLLEVAVVGVPDERWGERVVAVVVRARGAAVTDEDVVAHCEGRLAPYKRPRQVVFTDALPRNSFGKVQKDRVKRLVTDSTGG